MLQKNVCLNDLSAKKTKQLTQKVLILYNFNPGMIVLWLQLLPNLEVDEETFLST